MKTAGAGPTAIILAAGAGSRLRSVAPVKPLVEVSGWPLIAHALAAMAAAGAGRAVIVLGYQADAIAAAAEQAPLPVEFVHNPQWEETPNGFYLLAARKKKKTKS